MSPGTITVMVKPSKGSIRPGYKLIFRPFITTKSGKKIYASAIGKKAWPIWIPE